MSSFRRLRLIYEVTNVVCRIPFSTLKFLHFAIPQLQFSVFLTTNAKNFVQLKVPWPGMRCLDLGRGTNRGKLDEPRGATVSYLEFSQNPHGISITLALVLKSTKRMLKPCKAKKLETHHATRKRPLTFNPWKHVLRDCPSELGTS